MDRGSSKARIAPVARATLLFAVAMAGATQSVGNAAFAALTPASATANTTLNTPVNVTATVAGFDPDVCTGEATLAITRAPQHGSASILSFPQPVGAGLVTGTAVFHYVPASLFSGTDSFQYTASDATCAGPVTGTITVTVLNTSRDPTLDPSIQGVIGVEQRIPLLIALNQITNFNRHLDELRSELRNLNRLRVTFNGQPVSLSDLAGGADTGAVGSRLASLLPMAAPGSPGYPPSSPDGPPLVPLTQTAEASGKEGDAIELPDRIGVFINGNVSLGQITGTNLHPDASPLTRSLSTGIDYRLDADSVIGIGAGYTGNTTDIGGGSQVSSDAYNVTLYGTTRPVDQAYIDGVLSYGHMDFKSRRDVAAFGVVAQGLPHGDQVFGSLTGGWEFVTEEYTYGPYLRMNGSHNAIHPYTEEGAGAADLSVGPQTVDSLSSTLGFRGDRAISTSIGIVSPHIRVEYQHEFEGPQSANVGFSDGSASGFLISGYPISRNYFTLGLGASFVTENAISAFVDYDALVGYSHQTNHSITLGVSARF